MNSSTPSAGIVSPAPENPRTSQHEVLTLTRVLLPEIQAFFESEEGPVGVYRVEKATGSTQKQTGIANKAGTSLPMLPP